MNSAIKMVIKNYNFWRLIWTSKKCDKKIEKKTYIRRNLSALHALSLKISQFFFQTLKKFVKNTVFCRLGYSYRRYYPTFLSTVSRPFPPFCGKWATSEPLKRKSTIFGYITVSLFLKTDCPDFRCRIVKNETLAITDYQPMADEVESINEIRFRILEDHRYYF